VKFLGLSVSHDYPMTRRWVFAWEQKPARKLDVVDVSAAFTPPRFIECSKASLDTAREHLIDCHASHHKMQGGAGAGPAALAA